MYKKYFQGKKAAFFDLDGTVITTSKMCTDAVQKVLNDDRASYVNAEEYRINGYPMRTSWQMILEVNDLGPDKKMEDYTKLTEEAYVETVKKVDLIPTEGFWPLVYELKEDKGYKLALVTNTRKGVADVLIDKLGLREVFDLIICGDEVKRLKPDPEMYKKALKQLKLKPKEVVVFEDSIVGVTAATKAKLDIIVIWDKLTPKYLFPGKILDFMPDFSSLPGNLDETPPEFVKRITKEAEETKKRSEKSEL